MTLGRPAPPPSSRWAPLLPLLLLLLPSASIALRRGAPVRPRAAFSMAADLPPVGLPDGWAPPEPKPLSVPEGQLLNTLSGSVALALRLGVGAFVLGWKPGFTFGAKEGEYAMFNVVRDSSPTLQACRRPEKPLLLYEYEPSPYCRKVREACALLDLRVTMLPCPGARKGFADELGKRGGKMQVRARAVRAAGRAPPGRRPASSDRRLARSTSAPCRRPRAGAVPRRPERAGAGRRRRPA